MSKNDIKLLVCAVVLAILAFSRAVEAGRLPTPSSPPPNAGALAH
jgi:hypothetical protein